MGAPDSESEGRYGIDYSADGWEVIWCAEAIASRASADWYRDEAQRARTAYTAALWALDQVQAALTDAALCGCPARDGWMDRSAGALVEARFVSPRVFHQCDRNIGREFALDILLLRHGTGLLRPSRLTDRCLDGPPHGER